MHNLDADRSADIAVLTVVQAAHFEAWFGLKGALRGKISVDAKAKLGFRSVRER